MKIAKIIPLAASLVAVLMVSGCGSSNSAPAVSPNVVGKAFDGPINGATVCIDVNANGTCDAGEPTAKTDTFGKFDMKNPTGATGSLVLSGGTDTGTGLPFTGTLSAPVGSTVVNPMTAAIQSLVKSGSTAADAEKTIKKALNITSTEPLTSFDPFDKIKNGSAAQKKSAQEVLAAQAKLQSIVQSVATTVAGADNNKTVKDTMALAFKHVALGLEKAVTSANGKTVKVAATLVETATNDLATEVFSGNSKAQAAVKTAATNSAILAVATADEASTNITNANTSANVVTTFNQNIYVVNKTLTSKLNSDISDATSGKTLKPLTSTQAKSDAAAEAVSTTVANAVASAAVTQAKNECVALGGSYATGSCVMPVVTGGVSK